MADDRRNPRHLAFANKHYAGPGSGVEAARASGYRGSNAVLAKQAHRLLQIEWIRDAIRARGVDLPPAASGDGEPAAGPELDTSSPTAFFRSVASDASRTLAERLRAMERLEQIERRSGPGDSLESYQARQREWLAARRRERDLRAKTPEGAALEINALAQRLLPEHARRLRELAERIVAEGRAAGKARAA